MAEGTHLTGPAAVTQLALGAAREWAASAIRVADAIEAEGFEAAQKGAIFDMITPADGQIERFLRSEAARRFPDHHFLGEEEGGGALDDDALDVGRRPNRWDAQLRDRTGRRGLRRSRWSTAASR